MPTYNTTTGQLQFNAAATFVGNTLTIDPVDVLYDEVEGKLSIIDGFSITEAAAMSLTRTLISGSSVRLEFPQVSPVDMGNTVVYDVLVRNQMPAGEQRVFTDLTYGTGFAQGLRVTDNRATIREVSIRALEKNSTGAIVRATPFTDWTGPGTINLPQHTLWFFNYNSAATPPTTTAVAYNSITRARQPSKDFTVSGRVVGSGAYTDDTFWLPNSNNLIAYTASRQRNTSKDISLPPGLNASSPTSAVGAITDGSNLWAIQHFYRGTDGYSWILRGYTVSNRARNQNIDFTLPEINGAETWVGGGVLVDGDVWIVNNEGTGAHGFGDKFAFLFTFMANQWLRSGGGINLGRRVINRSRESWYGAATDGHTLWFVSDTQNIAQAWTVSNSARDRTRDIGLGSGNWRGAMSDWDPSS